MSTTLETEHVSAGDKHDDRQVLSPDTTVVYPRLSLWLSLIIIATVTFLTRVIGINYSDNSTPVFDEKHYAPQGYQMLMNGGLEDNPGYPLIVHPPMGKYLIAFGEMLFGYTPLGWRFTAIIASVVIVTTLAAIVWRMTHSLPAVAAVGVLGNTEGILHITGKTAMLDIFLTMFVVLGVFFIVMDISRDRSNTSWFSRYWLLLSGIMFGLAMSVKVSGVFYPALVGILLFLFCGRTITKKLIATAAGLIYFCVVPVIVFLISYTPWFMAENSVDRHAENNPLHSLIKYHMDVGSFHTTLLSSDGHVHPWESKPWHWLIGGRPMLYYTNTTTESVIGSGAGKENIWLATNPTVWLILVPVVLLLIYQLIRHKKKYHGIALAGILIGIVPWMIFHDRQMYLFYTAVVSPFLILGIVLLLKDLADSIARRRETDQENIQWIVLGSYSAVTIIAFILMSPWLYGIAVSDDIHEKVEIVESYEPSEPIDQDNPDAGTIKGEESDDELRQE